MKFETNFYRIGPTIRELRKLKGLSQKELCKNICSQSLLSKLEKGDVFALWDKLYLIAERLGIDVNYFYEIAKHSQTEFVDSVKERVRALVEMREYRSVYRMIKTHKTNPSFSKNKQNLQFLIWNEGICTSILSKNFEVAHQLLEEALNLTYTPPKYATEQELSIMNSIGVICFETNKIELAISTYNNALKEIRHTPIKIDKKVYIRILYNLSKALSSLGEYESSSDSCFQAIHACRGGTYNYLLGDLYHQIAFNSFFKGNFNYAEENLEKAIQLYSFYEDFESLDKSNKALLEVKEKQLNLL